MKWIHQGLVYSSYRCFLIQLSRIGFIIFGAGVVLFKSENNYSYSLFFLFTKTGTIPPIKYRYVCRPIRHDPILLRDLLVFVVSWNLGNSGYDFCRKEPSHDQDTSASPLRLRLRRLKHDIIETNDVSVSIHVAIRRVALQCHICCYFHQTLVLCCVVLAVLFVAK